MLFERKLGSGNYGTVYLARRADGRRVAAKLYKPEHKDLNSDVSREIRTLQGLDHPNVVRFLGLEHIDKDYVGQLAILMEYAEGGTLAAAIRYNSASGFANSRPIILQIASGLAYLHAERILHRDLKPSNILFRDTRHTHAVIADFGMADDQSYANYMGAKLFRPPCDYPFSRESDVYSLAVVACCVIVWQNPRYPYDVNRITEKAQRDVQLDQDQRRMLCQTLTESRKDRPSADQFKKACSASMGRETISPMPPPSYSWQAANTYLIPRTTTATAPATSVTWTEPERSTSNDCGLLAASLITIFLVSLVLLCCIMFRE